MNRLDSLKTRVWDAVVIGAGPAGGLLASCLARSGLRVLLLERLQRTGGRPPCVLRAFGPGLTAEVALLR